jgi:hypothetical protein
MATLDDVTQKLKENNVENQLGHEGTRIELTKIGRRFDNFFNMLSMDKLKDLEGERESKRKLPSAPPTKSSSSSSGGGLGLFGGLTGLGAITATVAGIAASLTGLDDAFKALRVGQIAKTLLTTAKAFNTRTLSFIDSVKDFGKGLKTFGTNFKNLLIIPDETKALFKNIPNNFQQGLFKMLGLGVDGKPVVTTPEGVKSFSSTIKGIQTSISNFLKPVTDIFSATEGESKISKAIKPITDFFDGISTKFTSIAKFFPSINFEALKGLFGSADEGTGLIGFFSKIFSFLDPLLKPFKYLIGLALRPIFQIVLTAIDFFVGFYEGFTGDKGDLLEKLKSGFEGGIKGVIKGFTDAIDLLFFKIPAFFAEKLGFEDASKKLKEFSLTALVDPAWESVKNFFKEAFTNPTSKIKEVTMNVGNMAESFLKSALRFVLPDPNNAKGLFQGLAVAGLKETGVYEYAGYTKGDDGKFVVKQNTLNRSNITNKQPTDLSPTDKSSSGKGAVVNNIVGGPTTNNTNAISNNATISTGQFMDLQDAFANYR